MINKIIAKQLAKCKIAQIPKIAEDTTSIVIPKYQELNLKIDSCYLIYIDDTIVHPSNDDLLVCNWNNNSHPKSNYLKVDVTKKLGKMIYVNSLYYDYKNKIDLNEMWSGWLPLEKIQLIKEL